MRVRAGSPHLGLDHTEAFTQRCGSLGSQGKGGWWVDFTDGSRKWLPQGWMWLSDWDVIPGPDASSSLSGGFCLPRSSLSLCFPTEGSGAQFISVTAWSRGSLINSHLLGTPSRLSLLSETLIRQAKGRGIARILCPQVVCFFWEACHIDLFFPLIFILTSFPSPGFLVALDWMLLTFHFKILPVLLTGPESPGKLKSLNPL